MAIRSAKKRLMAGILAVLQIAAPCELSRLVAEAAQQCFARGDVLVGLDALPMEPVNHPCMPRACSVSATMTCTGLAVAQ
jgi:hypothetical protein